jgi:hypothetical protein
LYPFIVEGAFKGFAQQIPVLATLLYADSVSRPTAGKWSAGSLAFWKRESHESCVSIGYSQMTLTLSVVKTFEDALMVTLSFNHSLSYSIHPAGRAVKQPFIIPQIKQASSRAIATIATLCFFPCRIM